LHTICVLVMIFLFFFVIFGIGYFL
jgi:hypothetical protein